MKILPAFQDAGKDMIYHTIPNDTDKRIQADVNIQNYGGHGRLHTALLALACFAVAVYAVDHTSFQGLLSAKKDSAILNMDAGKLVDPISSERFNSSEWRIQKYTINLLSGTGEAVQAWTNKYLCTGKSTTASSLGCGNKRAWCLIGLPYSSVEFGGIKGELHFVDAPSLNDLKIDGKLGNDWWVNYLEALNGDLSVFNAFMHNKAQFYVDDILSYEEKLTNEANVSLMKRSSVDSSGVEVAHLSFTIAGRVYELVAPLTSAGDASEYTRWSSATECPQSHLLGKTLDEYSALASKADDDFDENTPIMLVGLSMSYHDPTDSLVTDTTVAAARIRTLYDHISIVSGAKVKVEQKTDECVITHISWESMDGLTVRYVNNRKAPTGEYTLSDYDKYAYDDHHTYNNASGYDWDHVLDQHIGLFYAGAEEGCNDRAIKVRGLLDEAEIPRGERQETDAHEMYCGYTGPMTWQYQFRDCDAGRPSAPEECACVANNNLNHYTAVTGNLTCWS